MDPWRPPTERQLRRLVEDLDEAGLDLGGSEPWHALAVEEIAYAMRPMVHERYVPSYGAFVEPHADPARWSDATTLTIERRPVGDRATPSARRYADGLASWLLRRADGADEWVVLDRPAGSERDLVVLASALGAAVVQRHPTGLVRVVGPWGVYRWSGFGWYHEPLVAHWIASLAATCDPGAPEVLQRMLEFAVHDLGARGIGATLVYRADRSLGTFDRRAPHPPALRITDPMSLAPLRHALAQTDGAALFDNEGTLREIAVRLVPSMEAEVEVDGFRGMRHTSARRYSFDDPAATVVVVSEDGPVTVFRNGQMVGTALPADEPVTPG